jgi:hypothetical protein
VQFYTSAKLYAPRARARLRVRAERGAESDPRDHSVARAALSGVIVGMGAHGGDSSHRPPNISSLDSPMESNDGDLWSGMPSGIQEDDLRVLRHDSPWYSCCARLCRCWGGLRESDLDALQRRQKGAPKPRKSTPFAIPQLTVACSVWQRRSGPMPSQIGMTGALRKRDRGPAQPQAAQTRSVTWRWTTFIRIWTTTRRRSGLV